ncbi:D-alanine--D-alanine ligase [Alicyclobacillaceae bacterium I2511]|nr:D-alanine--D-alanine ligase [Alicyclobacillaceae bacterium I2511]
METIAVIFGGRSVEHEVSVVTALQVMENLDPIRFKSLPIYIAKDGRWYSSDSMHDIESFRQDKLAQTVAAADIVHWDPIPDSRVRLESQSGSSGEKHNWFKVKNNSSNIREVEITAVIPALHGTFGEDGSLQGFLELTGVPYTSAGVVGSAVGMDKIIMKSVFAGEGIPYVPYIWFSREQWELSRSEILQRVEEKLHYPLFVKPANLGSSVGISRADNESELEHAVEVAQHYDSRILVEQGLLDPVEINVSVLGDEIRAQASVCERPITWEKFLTYEDKYIRGNFNKGSGQGREIPARLPEQTTRTLQQLAVQVFHAVRAKGVVRVDFLISSGGEIFVNEVNTIPGSFAFYLWEPTGLPYRQMLTQLIDMAKASVQRQQYNITSFDTNLLEKFNGQKFSKR